MASFFAITPATVAGQAAIPAAAVQRLTITNAASATPLVVADSITVTLSTAARVLATIGNQPDATNSVFGTAQEIGSPSQTLTGADASAQNAFGASLALQALLDDPRLRAIKNQSDPLYSALIAASHLSDFVPAAFIDANPKTLTVETPTPVAPATASRAIDFYRQTAAELEQLSSS